jgi:predicted permease
VVWQVAVALVLLVGAGLLVRSVQRLKQLDLGIQPNNVMTFQVNLPAGRYPEASQRLAFYAAFRERLATMPNVRAAGAVSRLPTLGTFQSWGARHPGERRLHLAEQRVVDGDYFRALTIPLLSGRGFEPQDAAATERRIVISRSLADSMFPGTDPLGRPLQITNFRARVIGVVGDVALSARGLRAPTVYHSHLQFAANRNWTLTQVVATRAGDPALVQTIREQLRLLDPALVLHQPRPLTEVIGRGQAREKFSLQLIGLFAGLALILAAVGLYGVLAYAVASREREIGIRMALGATGSSVRGMFLRTAAKLAATGLFVGTIAALALTQGLRSLVFGVSLYDPIVFLGAALTLGSAAAAAGWIPARAAARVDPLHVLGR